MTYFVYILANKRNGTLYTGITNNIRRRTLEHKSEINGHGFTKTYQVKTLVYFEEHSDVSVAIAREKRLKKWKRIWKIRLIEKNNYEWKDLYDDI